jgi:hydrogenase-4 component F
MTGSPSAFGELTSPAGLTVLVPLLAAAILTALPSPKYVRWSHLGAAVVTLTVSLLLAWKPGRSGHLFLPDPPAAHLAILTAALSLGMAATNAVGVSLESEQRPLARRQGRFCPATCQALTGCVQLAILANFIAVTWMAAECATLATALAIGLRRTNAGRAAAWSVLVVASAGVALAAFGSVVLCAGIAPTPDGVVAFASWRSALTNAATGDVAMMNVAFSLLLAGFATFAGLAPMHAAAMRAFAVAPAAVGMLASGGAINVAVLIMLRLRAILSANAASLAPEPPIVAIGLATGAVAALALNYRPGLWRRVRGARLAHGGVAVIGIGLGTPASIFAGMFHLTVLTLLSVAATANTRIRDGGSATALGACLIALAGLPPFGLFASGSLVMVAAIGASPWLGLAVAVVLVATAWPLARAGHELLVMPAVPLRRAEGRSLWTWAVPATCLALGVWLGIAMPDRVAHWLQAVGGPPL